MIRDSIITKRLVGLFLLGYVLFNYPLLSLFNHNRLIFGIPMLYGYIFFIWVIMIFMVILIVNVKPSDH